MTMSAAVKSRKVATERLARAHYADAWLYDRRYGRRSVDIAYYSALAKKAKRVLELGAGTGRITLPLARAGVEVVAVEREQALIGRLRARLARESLATQRRVTIVHDDFRTLRKTRGRFPLVIAPFNALSHCYDARTLAQVLAVIRTRLAPGARFAFDVPLPCPETLAYDPDRRYRVGNATGSDRTRYAYYESFEYDAAAQTLLIVAHYDRIDPRTKKPRPNDQRSFVLPLLHRMHFPQELALVLDAAGFSIVSHAGDFAGAPLTGDADSQVIVAKRAK